MGKTLPTSTLLFVCRECSRRSDEPDLRKYLKKRLREDGLKKDVRVVRTECMGLCPDDGLVSVCESKGKCRAVCPANDREALYLRLVELVEASR